MVTCWRNLTLKWNISEQKIAEIVEIWQMYVVDYDYFYLLLIILAGCFTPFNKINVSILYLLYTYTESFHVYLYVVFFVGYIYNHSS